MHSDAKEKSLCAPSTLGSSSKSVHLHVQIILAMLPVRYCTLKSKFSMAFRYPTLTFHGYFHVYMPAKLRMSLRISIIFIFTKYKNCKIFSILVLTCVHIPTNQKRLRAARTVILENYDLKK